MQGDHRWEKVASEGPIEGYATLTYRMQVPDGYLYNTIVRVPRGVNRP
jgi:hypothetical protein